MGLAVGAQEPIRGGRAHRKEQAAVVLAQLEVSSLLQGGDDLRQKGDQAFGADPIEGLPGQHSCRFDLEPVTAARSIDGLHDLLGMVE